MRRVCTFFAVVVFVHAGFSAAAAQAVSDWPPHDLSRPRPAKVTPMSGVFTPPPPDAIVLFGGTDLSAWTGGDGAAAWTVHDGFVEIVPGAGQIATREGFGDVQLHVEWAAPSPARGSGQEPGNSGVFLMGRYEVQILDTYQNETYADGQAGALYGQYPPLVNASLPAGEWQSYDIVFHRPHFAEDGSVESPARFTVLHNGVLIHDNVALVGPTAHQTRPPYSAHAARLPITLQDHGERVRYRNIWVRDLER
ncbi:MAG: 3-keto-disaccharide hydrolase [Longimicrobiales bacterium]